MRAVLMTDVDGLPLAIDADQVFLVRAALKKNEQDIHEPWPGHTAVYLRQQPGQPLFVQGDATKVAEKVFHVE